MMLETWNFGKQSSCDEFKNRSSLSAPRGKRLGGNRNAVAEPSPGLDPRDNPLNSYELFS